MRSISRRFKNIEDKHPDWSSFICFSMAIREQEFNKQAIHRWFLKLVSKDDYSPADKKALLVRMEEVSKRLEDNNKSG